MGFSSNSPERRARLLTDIDSLVPDKTIKYLSLHNPFRFQERTDNLVYVARRGDRLEHVANVFYRDPQLFWVLADYQPDPIFNPMAPLEEGRRIYGPSIQFLQEEIIGR